MPHTTTISYDLKEVMNDINICYDGFNAFVNYKISESIGCIQKIYYHLNSDKYSVEKGKIKNNFDQLIGSLQWSLETFPSDLPKDHALSLCFRVQTTQDASVEETKLVERIQRLLRRVSKKQDYYHKVITALISKMNQIIALPHSKEVMSHFGREL